MTYTDDQLSAFIDHELPQKQMADIEAACERDPALQQRLDDLRQASRLGATYLSTIDTRPLPQDLRNLIATNPLPKAANDRSPFGGSSIWPTAIAASLALMVGLFAGRSLLAPTPTQMDNILLANNLDAPFAEVLETTPSTSPVRVANYDATLTPLVSFQNKDGAFCRQFIIEAAQQAKQAVACKTDDQWQLQIIVATKAPNHNNDSYQTASAASNRSMDHFIQNSMAEAPLSREEEQSAIARKWQSY